MLLPPLASILFVFFSTLTTKSQKVAIIEKKSSTDKVAVADWRLDAYRPRSADPKGREVFRVEDQKTTLESQRLRSEIAKLEEERKQERGKNHPLLPFLRHLPSSHKPRYTVHACEVLHLGPDRVLHICLS